MSFTIRLLTLVVIPVFSALLTTATARAAELPAPRLPSNYLPVPLVPQATSYSCGAASLMAVMEYWGVFDAPETTLYAPLHTTPKDGTQETEMAKLAQTEYGLRAEIRTELTLDDLRDALKDGTTVIVNLQAWADDAVTDWKNRWEDGHYAVLVGMDTDYAYFMDPSAHGAYAYLPLIELLDRWHDYDDTHGTIIRTYHMGIFIHGTKARTQFPSELIRIL